MKQAGEYIRIDDEMCFTFLFAATTYAKWNPGLKLIKNDSLRKFVFFS